MDKALTANSIYILAPLQGKCMAPTHPHDPTQVNRPPSRSLRSLLRCTLVLTAALLLPSASPCQSLAGKGPVVPNTTLGCSRVPGASEPRIKGINGKNADKTGV